nr:hypothetical protein GCM10020092_001170 [Actinoplanes digitatis]
MAGRNQPPGQPYVPAPALPTMHAAPPLENGFPPAPAPDSTQPFGERPRMGGVFPGPASRATVAPPDPEQTANWPSRPAPGEADQGRFDSFRPDAPEPAPAEAAKPETPHVRMLPVILGVILGAGLLVGLTLGITWLIARGSHDGDTGGSGFSVKARRLRQARGHRGGHRELHRRGLLRGDGDRRRQGEVPRPQPAVRGQPDHRRRLPGALPQAPRLSTRRARGAVIPARPVAARRARGGFRARIRPA